MQRFSPARWRGGRSVVLVLAAAAIAAGCGAKKDEAGAGSAGTAAGGEAQECGQVTLNENTWIGSTANVYVAKHVLEEELGCDVQVTKIAEIPAFQAMSDGKVDAVLEDWQHTTEYAKYIDDLGTVKDAGSLGVTGHIGWYTPKYVVEEYPELDTWEGLKQHWEIFKTAESGDKGQLLDGDPSYVTNDEALVKNLGLNLKVVYAGGEASQISAVKQAYAQKEPILFYWYTPQWLNSVLEFEEVDLPEWTEGCDADPKTVKCAYPDYDLRKLMSTEFADSGSPAVKFIQNFEWSNDEQEKVGSMIANDKMAPEEAAAQWVEENPDSVQAWLEGVSS